MNNNTLAFIALCNEYCAELEKASGTDARDFLSKMLDLLPRIYITARDLHTEGSIDEGYIDPVLEEDSYDRIRRSTEIVLGEHDTFLEVFEADMKYSDTPLAASVSESLADLFQVFYNFLETVRDAPEELIESAVEAIKEDFRYNWAQTLCNVLRPINSIYYNEYV